MQSARAVMDALRAGGHEVVPIGITPEGRWLVGGDPLKALLSGERTSERPVSMLPQPGTTGLVPLRDDGESRVEPYTGGSASASVGSLDVLFPVLHGTYGEDGTVQGLFDLAAVPYAGAGVLGSALGMDKVVQKTLWRGLGLPVTDFLAVSAARLRARCRGGPRCHRTRHRLPGVRQARESRLQRWRLQGRIPRSAATGTPHGGTLRRQADRRARHRRPRAGGRRPGQRRPAGLDRRRDPARRRVLRLSRQVPGQRLARRHSRRHPVLARRRGQSAGGDRVQSSGCLRSGARRLLPRPRQRPAAT